MSEEKDLLTGAEEDIPSAEKEENIRSDAFTEGEARGRAAAAAEIAALKAALEAAQDASARREAEVICGRLLRERNLDERLTEVILPPGTGAADADTLAERADAIAHAVRQAAVEELRRRAVGVRPGSGGEAPLTGAMIRELPLARLAELRGK